MMITRLDDKCLSGIAGGYGVPALVFQFRLPGVAQAHAPMQEVDTGGPGGPIAAP